MSYTTFDELEESPMTLIRTWFPNGHIPERSVMRRNDMEDTIRFQKKYEEEEPVFDVKFQIPCDTITSSSACYQQTKRLYLVR